MAPAPHRGMAAHRLPLVRAGVRVTKRFPFSGIPQGWYVIATSAEVRPGQVVGRRYFDRELVLYRTESGIVRAVDGHCPHMGAHLEAGRVVGEQLRCAFHGFQFDLDGICVATPYGEGVPPRARLSTWLLREQNGLILTWFDTEGKPPEWTVPELPCSSWNGLVWHRYTDLETHPQETTENSVDFGHFTSIHNFTSAEMTRDLVTDGPLLQSSYAIHASLQSVKDRLQTAKDETAATVKAKLDKAKAGLAAGRASVEKHRQQMLERIETKKVETEQQIAKWKAERNLAKLAKRAERSESYAAAAIVIAGDAMAEAEIATLEAIEARMLSAEAGNAGEA